MKAAAQSEDGLGAPAPGRHSSTEAAVGRANRRSYARLPAGSWHPLLAQSCQPGRGRLLVGVLSTPTRGHQGAGGGTGDPIRLGRSRAFLGRGEGRRARPHAPGTFAPSSSPRARCCPSSYTRLDRSLLCHKKTTIPTTGPERFPKTLLQLLNRLCKSHRTQTLLPAHLDVQRTSDNRK